MATGTINLTTGSIIGSIKLNFPFEFVITSAAPNDIQITGSDNEGSPYQWFDGDPATISQGTTSVTVTATVATSAEEPYFTCGISGMAGAANVHVIVSSS